MKAAYLRSVLSQTRRLVWAVAFAALSAPAFAAEPTATLRLTIKDAATGEAVPARVEVRGADGSYHVARDALRVGGDCDMSDRGAGFVDLESTLAGFSDRIHNPYAMSTQFYSGGTSSLQLPAGNATVRVFKGPEYRVPVASVDIPTSGITEHEISLERWADMPKQGWYSADDHLHIPRPAVELNPYISKMMQAEDIHVGNLLQMGKVKNIAIATQHAHGPDGLYREGDYILAAGQENPRTHFLGHTITLGAPAFTYDPDKYLIYRLIWQQTAKQGAINGFAHAYAPAGSPIAPHDGMAVVLPHNLLHFVEVLQFNRSGYEAWYDMLALGFRVTPTAGTDFPCADQTLPGHERFYTKVEGPLTYAKWLKSVRQGRTFVTSGPMIEFRINGRDIGSEIVLEAGGSVEVSGRASFDPKQDDLAFLELVQNGEVVDRFSRVRGQDEIRFEVRRDVEGSSWFAVRGYGVRLEEDPLVLWATRGTSAGPIQFSSFKPTSNVHTAPIYVALKGHPGVSRSPRSRRIAATWLARLNDLESVLAPENLAYLGAKLEIPNFDAVPAETLRKNRDDLLKEIAVAKAFFAAFAK
jgi:hypothetical protein